MLGEDYSYLASRLVAERDRVRSSACPEAATAHEKLANAYLERLQSLMLSPGMNRQDIPSVPGRGGAKIAPAASGFKTCTDMHIAHARKSDPS